MPESVAVGDFLGNGVLDLAVANQGDNTVSVLLGNGDGSLQAARNYAVGTNPVSVVVGDFLGNGILDLAVANQGDNTVSVLLGNGDGSFQAAVSHAAGSSPSSVAVGDFNGDGILDLAVTDSAVSGGSPGVTVLRGNGDGSFQFAGSYSAGISPGSVAVGDFRGNGIADLVVADSNLGTNSLYVLLGNGDGTLQAAVRYTVGVGPASVAVGDFVGNRIPDLVVANPGTDNVSVLLGNGDGSFQTAVNYTVGTLPLSVAVGDFNGDGVPDLVTANPFNSTVSVLLGNGDGTFQAAQNVSAGSGPVSVAVGDFNGDGRSDLAVADFDSGQVSVLLNDGVWTGASPGPGGGRSSGIHLVPRTQPAPPDLAVAEEMRRDPSAAAVTPPQTTVTFVQDSQPLRGADAEPAGTRATGARVSTPKPPALAPVWAPTEGTSPWLLDRLFAEPESGALGVLSAQRAVVVATVIVEKRGRLPRSRTQPWWRPFHVFPLEAPDFIADKVRSSLAQ
jgi:hypothetical protein